MEDNTWGEVETQIRDTKEAIQAPRVSDDIHRLILKNQLAIMKALNKLDDKIRHNERIRWQEK